MSDSTPTAVTVSEKKETCGVCGSQWFTLVSSRQIECAQCHHTHEIPHPDTTVTVSDRMRGFVDTLVGASEGTEAESRATDALLREIGWLETVIDQRGKRIQELEQYLTDYEMPIDLTGILETRSAVEDRPITNPSDVSTSSGVPPQTRGEAIPVSTASFNEGKFSDRPIRLTGSSALIVELDVERQKLAALEAENARLLTALDEKEQRITDMERNYAIVTDWWNTAKQEIESLQSSAVLQKEELLKVIQNANGVTDDITKQLHALIDGARAVYLSHTSGA